MAALQVGFQDELADMGAADDHRFEQQQAGDVVAPFGDQGGERTAGPHAAQQDALGAADTLQPVDRGLDALLPGRPVRAALVEVGIERIARSGIVEAQRRIAGGGQVLAQHPERAVGEQTLAHHALTDQDGDVAAPAFGGAWSQPKQPLKTIGTSLFRAPGPRIFSPIAI